MATLAEDIVTLEALTIKAKSKAEAKRDAFIRARTQWEQTIDSLREGIQEADPEIMAVLNLPEEITCQALLPSLYKDVFVPEDYEREKKSVDEIRLAIGRILREMVNESIKITEDYLGE